jgi:hypothetical protein
MLSKRNAGRYVAQRMTQIISTVICLEEYPILYTRHPQPATRVPSMALGTIFNSTRGELKCSNYNPIQKLNLLYNRRF